MNLDALVRSASLIFLFHQRFLLLESVYFLISVLFYFIQKVGAPCPPPPAPQSLPLRGPWLHKPFLAHALKSSIHDHFISFYFIQKVGAPWNLTRLPQMHIDDSPVSVQHNGTQPDTTPP